mgnify:CR=1 FL=1
MVKKMTSYNNKYYAYYNLLYDPFVKNNSDEFIYESRDYKQFTYRLNYLLNTKGIGLVTGNPGLGKTTSIRKVLSSLNKGLYKPIYISLTTLTNNEFIRQLLVSLGREPCHKKSDNVKEIQKAIIDYAENKKITPVIVIDEANYLSSSLLNDIKMIFNFKMDSCDKYVLILVGLPSLSSSLAYSNQEPLRQRIIMNYNFSGLNKEECRSYIEGKLEKAGGTISILENQALQALMNASGCNPRVTNLILSNALVIGEDKKMANIDEEIMMAAINETYIL